MTAVAARTVRTAASPAVSLASTPAAVDPLTAKRWVDDGEAILVDVREIDEFEMERIPGSLLAPKSSFDAARFPRAPGKKVVLVCLVGRRSVEVGAWLKAAGYPEPAYSLDGGILGWSAAGMPTFEAA